MPRRACRAVRRRSHLPLALFLAALPARAAVPPTRAADLPPRPPVEVARTSSVLRIDGVLDEEAWASATVIDDFLQQLPLDAAPPGERTEVLVLYDDEVLYLGFRCYDRDPSKIQIGALLRDKFESAGGELVTWAIDSTNSGRDGYWFSSNPGGAQADSQVVNEGEVFRPEWDGVWDAAGRIDAEGWTLEVALPFFNLQFHAAEVNVMRINFFRAIRHLNEEDYAPYIPRNYPAGTNSFSIGRPMIFHDIRPGRRVQVKPYGLVGADEDSRIVAPDGTLTSDSDVTGDVGLDVKWAVTPNWTADFTLNPDFAQADADQVQINLTRFPLFFPEKRDFFLENGGLFDVGAPGDLLAFFSRRIGLDEEASAVPLLGGARLTGRQGPWSVGVLDVVADDNPTQERTNYFVARARRDVLQRSSVGGIVTDRHEQGEGSSRLAGADALFRFHEDHRVEAFAIATRDSGDKTRWAGSATYAKRGDRWEWQAGGSLVDPGFAPAIGFVRRNGIEQGITSLAFRPRPAGMPSVRQFEFGATLLYVGARVDDPALDGSLLDRSFLLFHETRFETGDKVGADLEQAFVRLTEPFEIIDGVIIPVGDYDNDSFVVDFETYEGRRLSGFGEVSYGTFFDGHRGFLRLGLNARFNRYLALASSFSRNRVRTPYGDFDTDLWINQLDYGFTPRLFGSVLLQWNDVTNDLDLSLRLRWRHHPGSDLFVVYNESHNTDRLPGEPPSNFRQGIVKLTWAIFL